MTAKTLTLIITASLIILTCWVCYDLCAERPLAMLAYQHLETKRIVVRYHGITHQVCTYRNSLDQLLNDLDLKFTRGDTLRREINSTRVPLTYGEPLQDGMTIVIDNVITTTQVEKVDLPYQTRRVKDGSLPVGETRTTPGQPGVLERRFLVTLCNGEEVSRELLAEEVIKEPEDKVVYVGQKNVSTGVDLSNAQPLVVEATAYTYTGNPTATGVYPRRGVIAVDPSVIPLYSQVYIPGYGVAQALDTGGAIKGNRIDIFFEDRQQALDFGRQTLTIYLLH